VKRPKKNVGRKWMKASRVKYLSPHPRSGERSYRRQTVGTVAKVIAYQAAANGHMNGSYGEGRATGAKTKHRGNRG